MKKFLIVGYPASYGHDIERMHSFRTFGDEMQKLHLFQAFLGEAVADFATVDEVAIDKLFFDIRPDSFEVTIPELGINLRDYDAIYVRSPRTLGNYVCQFARYNGIPFLNDYTLYYSGTKVCQTLEFLQAGVPFIPTYYAINNEVLIRSLAEKASYPYILKADTGSQGRSNYLIHNEDEARQRIAAEPDVDFIAQDFCRNDRDYRLLMVGDENLLFERRGVSGSHLNNTSKGGSATPVDEAVLPEHIRLQARQLANRLGLTIAGFDVIPELDSGDCYFLEINSQPQLRSGMLLAEKKELVKKLFASF